MLVRLRQKAFLKEPRLTEIWIGSMVLLMVHLLYIRVYVMSSFQHAIVISIAGGPGGVGKVLSCRNWHNEESYVSMFINVEGC